MAAVTALIDTGAILGLADQRDVWHRACEEVFREARLPFLTSEAVLTELFHLLGDSPRAIDTAWGLLRSGVITIGPIIDADLAALHSLMIRYRDRPMDFADATLVHLAHREGISTIFTTDHNDFETYRIDGRRRFEILPPRTAAR